MEKQFKMQHHLRHILYDKSASKLGYALGSLDLTGEMNKDWMFRHAARHVTYQQIMKGASASPVNGLSSVNLDDHRSMQTWMHLHAQTHVDLDVFFGIHS